MRSRRNDMKNTQGSNETTDTRLEAALKRLAGRIDDALNAHARRKGGENAAQKAHDRSAWRDWQSGAISAIRNMLPSCAFVIELWDDPVGACRHEIAVALHSEAANGRERIYIATGGNTERREHTRLEAIGNPAKLVNSCDKGRKAIEDVARAQIETLSASAHQLQKAIEGMRRIRGSRARDGAAKGWLIAMRWISWLERIDENSWHELEAAPAWLARSVLEKVDPATIKEGPEQWVRMLCEMATSRLCAGAVRIEASKTMRCLQQWPFPAVEPPIGVVACLVNQGRTFDGTDAEWAAAIGLEQWRAIECAANEEQLVHSAQNVWKAWRKRRDKQEETLRECVEAEAEGLITTGLMSRKTSEPAWSDLEKQSRVEASKLLAQAQQLWDECQALKRIAPDSGTLALHEGKVMWRIEAANAASLIVCASQSEEHILSSARKNAQWRPERALMSIAPRWAAQWKSEHRTQPGASRDGERARVAERLNDEQAQAMEKIVRSVWPKERTEHR